MTTWKLALHVWWGAMHNWRRAIYILLYSTDLSGLYTLSVEVRDGHIQEDLSCIQCEHCTPRGCHSHHSPCQVSFWTPSMLKVEVSTHRCTMQLNWCHSHSSIYHVSFWTPHRVNVALVRISSNVGALHNLRDSIHITVYAMSLSGFLIRSMWK